MSTPPNKSASDVTFETWLRSELQEAGVTVELPPMPTPGGLAILVPNSQYELFRIFDDSSVYRIWEVRGVLDKPTWPYKAQHFLTVSKDGLKASTTGAGGSGAYVVFHFRADGQGQVSDICTRVEERTPVAALGRARQPLEQFLDELCSWAYMPMRFLRFEVAVSADAPTLATETYLPFGPNSELDSHTHLPPCREWLWIINELFREARSTNSPYYRLLVAFRIVEAIGAVKKVILSVSRTKRIQARLPKNLRILKSEIHDRGATIDPKLAKKGESLSLQELYETWRDKRNAVAHLLFERLGKTRILILSDPTHYRDFACSAAILLFYSQQTYNELRTFLLKHIAPFPEIVSVLPRLDQDGPIAGYEKIGVVSPFPTKFSEWGRRS
jgi:hypothetical protein